MDRQAIDWMTTLSVALGVYLVLAGVATLVGMPWRYESGGVVLAVLQVMGALLTMAFGVGLGWTAIRTKG